MTDRLFNHCNTGTTAPNNYIVAMNAIVRHVLQTIFATFPGHAFIHQVALSHVPQEQTVLDGLES